MNAQTVFAMMFLVAILASLVVLTIEGESAIRAAWRARKGGN